jgi:hypothetical protein
MPKAWGHLRLSGEDRDGHGSWGFVVLALIAVILESFFWVFGLSF